MAEENPQQVTFGAGVSLGDRLFEMPHCVGQTHHGPQQFQEALSYLNCSSVTCLQSQLSKNCDSHTELALPHKLPASYPLLLVS